MTQEQVRRNLDFAQYLRNPDLKQARKRLRSNDDPDAKCCLGHACDFSAKHGLDGSWQKKFEGSLDETWVYLCKGEEDDQNAPAPVSNWFGWNGNNPESPIPVEYYEHPSVLSVAELNDNVKLELPQIADHFEAIATKGQENQDAQ